MTHREEAAALFGVGISILLRILDASRNVFCVMQVTRLNLCARRIDVLVRLPEKP